MELSQIIPHIEALIFASDKPLNNLDILEMVNNALAFIEDRASMQQVDAAIAGIAEKYNSEFYAFELRESGGGWQFLTKKEYYKTVAQLSADKFIKKLSTAALETLSIIAYKQPITKSEIEHIRGVNSDYAVQKLLEKELVIIAGRNELAVGKPLIYETSKSFMDYFGINSSEDLPKIREVLMEELALPSHSHEEDTVRAIGPEGHSGQIDLAAAHQLLSESEKPIPQQIEDGFASGVADENDSTLAQKEIRENLVEANVNDLKDSKSDFLQ